MKAMETFMSDEGLDMYMKQLKDQPDIPRQEIEFLEKIIKEEHENFIYTYTRESPIY